MSTSDKPWVPNPKKLRDGMSVPTPGVIFPRAALESVEGFNTYLRVASDFETLLKMQITGWPFKVEEGVLTNYLGGGLSTRMKYLAFFEECMIQLRHGVQTATSFLRWRLALQLGRHLLY
jgi:hypothetical protein